MGAAPHCMLPAEPIVIKIPLLPVSLSSQPWAKRTSAVIKPKFNDLRQSRRNVLWTAQCGLLKPLFRSLWRSLNAMFSSAVFESRRCLLACYLTDNTGNSYHLFFFICFKILIIIVSDGFYSRNCQILWVSPAKLEVYRWLLSPNPHRQVGS